MASNNRHTLHGRMSAKTKEARERNAGDPAAAYENSAGYRAWQKSNAAEEHAQRQRDTAANQTEQKLNRYGEFREGLREGLGPNPVGRAFGAFWKNVKEHGYVNPSKNWDKDLKDKKGMMGSPSAETEKKLNELANDSKKTNTLVTDSLRKIDGKLEDILLSQHRMENNINKILMLMNTNKPSPTNRPTSQLNSADNIAAGGSIFLPTSGARPTTRPRPGSTSRMGRIGRGLGTGLAVAGAGLAAYDEYSTSGNGARAGSVGGGALAGMLAGGKIGAIGGSFGGPVGSFVGGLAGSAIGGFAGSSFGRGIYDTLSNIGGPRAPSIAGGLMSGDRSPNIAGGLLSSTTTRTESNLRNNEREAEAIRDRSQEISISTNNYKIDVKDSVTIQAGGKIEFKGSEIVFNGTKITNNGVSSGVTGSGGGNSQSPNITPGATPTPSIPSSPSGSPGRAGNYVSGGQSPTSTNSGPWVGGRLAGGIGPAPDFSVNSLSGQRNGPSGPIGAIPNNGDWSRGTRFGSAANRERANWAIDYLVKNHNLTPAQAAGVVGNAHQESSGFRASAVNNNGERSFGLFQWNGPRQDAFRQWAATNGKNANDPQAQLDYAIHEAGQRRDRRGVSDLDHLRRQENPQDASRSWMQRFERPRDAVTGGQNDRSRGNASSVFHNNYVGQQGSSPQTAPHPIHGGQRPITNPQSGAGGSGWHMPSSGTVGSQFGMRRHPIHGTMRLHGGTDIRPPERGQLVPVHAMRDGVVTSVNRHGDVTIKHDNGYTTTYRHIDPSGIREGQRVKGGETIGQLTRHDSRSTGPHLHIEANGPDGRRINPAQLIPELGQRGSRMVGGQFVGQQLQPQSQQAVTQTPVPVRSRSFLEVSGKLDGQFPPMQGFGDSPARTASPVTNSTQPRPFQSLPEDGSGMAGGLTARGMSSLQESGANYIRSRRNVQTPMTGYQPGTSQVPQPSGSITTDIESRRGRSFVNMGIPYRDRVSPDLLMAESEREARRIGMIDMEGNRGRAFNQVNSGAPINAPMPISRPSHILEGYGRENSRGRGMMLAGQDSTVLRHASTDDYVARLNQEQWQRAQQSAALMQHAERQAAIVNEVQQSGSQLNQAATENAIASSRIRATPIVERTETERGTTPSLGGDPATPPRATPSGQFAEEIAAKSSGPLVEAPERNQIGLHRMGSRYTQ